MTHEGWSNYVTWAVKLWMANEEGSCRYWQAEAEDYRDDADGLASVLKEAHEVSLPELEGFAADLLNAAFAEVNWTEIAESLIGDLEPEEEDDA